MGDQQREPSSSSSGGAGGPEAFDKKLHQQAMQAVRTRAKELLANGQMSTDISTIYQTCENSKTPALIVKGALVTATAYGVLGIIGRKYPQVLNYRLGPALLAGYGFYEEGKKDEYIATMCERILMARPGDGDTEELRQTYASIYPNSEFYRQCKRISNEMNGRALSIRDVVDPWPITQKELRMKWIKEVRKEQGKETPEYRPIRGSGDSRDGDREMGSDDNDDSEMAEYFDGNIDIIPDRQESAQGRVGEPVPVERDGVPEPPFGWVSEQTEESDDRSKHAYGESFDPNDYFRGRDNGRTEQNTNEHEDMFDGKDEQASPAESEDDLNEVADKRLSQADQLALERRRRLDREALRREKRNSVVGRGSKDDWEDR